MVIYFSVREDKNYSNDGNLARKFIYNNATDLILKSQENNYFLTLKIYQLFPRILEQILWEKTVKERTFGTEN